MKTKQTCSHLKVFQSSPHGSSFCQRQNNWTNLYNQIDMNNQNQSHHAKNKNHKNTAILKKAKAARHLHERKRCSPFCMSCPIGLCSEFYKLNLNSESLKRKIKKRKLRRKRKPICTIGIALKLALCSVFCFTH